MTAFFNTGLTQQQFLQQYWQKKPLLIRQAFSDFQSPISPDDLAGLACEPEIESRLIEEKGALGPWQVRSGPLTEDDFARLPSTHWTMLVQDVDKHLPELQSLLDPFRFIPDWRRDDLMVSYAPQHGSVGPHTDGYDVFLLQAMGERRWQINDKAMTDAALIEGLDVQILQEFHPDQSWDLQPGDMLYLPPGTGVPTRVHGAFIDDHEVHAVVRDWKSRGEPNYLDEIITGDSEQEILLPGEQSENEAEELDTLYDEALAFVTETRRVSISSVQRKFRIGYNRAARIVEQMEVQGIVTTPGHNGAREVLAPAPIRD